MRYILKDPKSHHLPLCLPAFLTSRTEKVIFFFSFSVSLFQAAADSSGCLFFFFFHVFSSSKILSRFPPGLMFTFFLSMRAKPYNRMLCFLLWQHGFPQSPHATGPSSLLSSLHRAGSSALQASGSLHLASVGVFLCVVLSHPYYFFSYLNPTLASDLTLMSIS